MALLDPTYKFLSALRIGFSVFLLVFLIGTGAFAQELVEETAKSLPASSFEDPYLVENIEVDATADNAVEARTKAFEAAQIRGYEELAKRFLPETDLSSFETPDIKIIEAYVQDFEVTNEKLSATRYKGVYNIRFAKNTFQSAGAYNSASETMLPQNKELLLIPFMEVNNRYYLWQINPFWEAWTRAQSNKVLGKIIVPVGDSTDISQIRDGQRLTYNPALLNAMQSRYRANETVIVVASPEPLQDNTTNIAIGIYKPQPYGPELAQQLSVKSYPAEDREQLYNRVVATIAQALHTDWKRPTAAQQQVPGNTQTPAINNPYQNQIPQAPILSGAKNNIIAQLQFSGARQWVNTKKAIEAISGVETVQIKSLSSRSATIDINFLGSVDQLRAALLQQGMRLNDTTDGSIYQLSALR